MKKIMAILFSIFGIGHSTENNDQYKSNPLISMVMLNSITPMSKMYTLELLKSSLGKSIEIEKAEISDELAMVNFKGGQLIAMNMGAPIPWGDLEGPANTSWMWPNAVTEIKAHRNHVIVTLLGSEKTALERHLLLSKFTSVILQANDAIGVYWGNGTTVIPKKRFIELDSSNSTDHPAIMLWCEFRVQKNPDKSFNIITNGMRYLGSMDIEMIGSKSGEEDLYFSMDLAVYMAKGNIIKDGDTVGGSSNERIKTKYMKSVWDRPDKVLRIYK